MIGGQDGLGVVELYFHGLDLGGEVGFVGFEFGDALEDGAGVDIGGFEGVAEAGEGAVDVGALGVELGMLLA